MCECMQHLFPIFVIWKKLMPVVKGATLGPNQSERSKNFFDQSESSIWVM